MFLHKLCTQKRAYQIRLLCINAHMLTTDDEDGCVQVLSHHFLDHIFRVVAKESRIGEEGRCQARLQEQHTSIMSGLLNRERVLFVRIMTVISLTLIFPNSFHRSCSASSHAFSRSGYPRNIPQVVFRDRCCKAYTMSTPTRESGIPVLTCTCTLQ